MKFRESVLEVLRQPGYRPSTILDISRAIGLNKKQRPQLAHEIRTLLGKGELSLVNGDRIVLPNYRASSASSKPAREVFQPRSQQNRRDSAPESSANRETLTGRISFRAGGSAFVLPVRDTTAPSSDVESIQIFPEDTGVALHGDVVEILVNPGIRQRRDGRR